MLDNRKGRDVEYCIVHEHCINARNDDKLPENNSCQETPSVIQLFCRHICVVAFIFVGFIFVLLMLPVGLPHGKILKFESFRLDSLNTVKTCNIQLVESIPEGMQYSPDSPKFLSTYEAWQTLFNLAKVSLNIGSFYWTLRESDVFNHSTSYEGEQIFQLLLHNGINKNLDIRIAQSSPKGQYDDADTKTLMDNGAAIVKSVNFSRLLGNGVLHTKVWIVDDEHFYLGSANMDWRSLTQVKELGVLGQNCNAMVSDLLKIFEIYWYLGDEKSKIPSVWPWKYYTNYNSKSPMIVKFNEQFIANTYFTNSPPPLSAPGREQDVDAIVSIILNATQYVNIAVMDYFPMIIYEEKMKYWPIIDNAIRKAALENKVRIRMLISWWMHSKETEDYFLRSLQSISNSLNGVSIEIRRFVVPADEDQKKIPYSRVNHNKYMVTDNTAYIGTSNWSGDYFINTAGIGLVVRDEMGENNTLRMQLGSVFERDWNSVFSLPIKD